jgi:hypothetical protein
MITCDHFKVKRHSEIKADVEFVGVIITFNWSYNDFVLLKRKPFYSFMLPISRN